MIETIVLVVHVITTIALITLVMLQTGKGAEAGAAFGGGASSTVFGSAGSSSFLSRTTAILATVFFVTSLSLAYLGGKESTTKSVTEVVAPQQTESDRVTGPADVPSAPMSESSDVPTPVKGN